LELEPHVQVAVFQLDQHPVHHFVDAVVGLVQAFDEEVADFRHQVGEAEEAVAFGVLWKKKRENVREGLGGGVTSEVDVGVAGEGVVDGADDFVHPLDVALAGVELGVEEEDALDDLPVGLFALGHGGVVFVGFLDRQRYLDRSKQCNVYVT
jgi:hypothetical protein